MAKAEPSLTLVGMESKLGYKVDSLTYPEESSTRFYSDLRRIPSSTYEKSRVEFEAYDKKVYREDKKAISGKVLPESNVARTIAYGDDTVTLTRRNDVVFYSITVDIHHGCGFDLPLLFTSAEAFKTLAVAKLQPNTGCSVSPMFCRLPKEVRDKIYIFALASREWEIRDMDSCNGINFAGCIGDPSGFYFPFSELAILRVDRQMRQEALPLAYRKMVFRVDDMDDLVKFLIAIGRIGRDNIESLEFSWEIRADSDLQWEEASYSDDLFMRLSSLHASKCVQLLKQCKRLKFLRLNFERDLILNISPDVFKTDPGIRELCSVRAFERVGIWTLARDPDPIEHHGLGKWLKGELESPLEPRKNEGKLNIDIVINELGLLLGKEEEWAITKIVAKWPTSSKTIGYMGCRSNGDRVRLKIYRKCSSRSILRNLPLVSGLRRYVEMNETCQRAPRSYETVKYRDR